MGKITDIERWRCEIDTAERVKKEMFGEYSKDSHEKVGELIDYFDRGFSTKMFADSEDLFTTLNLVHAIVKNIVPLLYFQNPKILSLPRKVDSQDSAPTVAEILNYFFKKLDMEEINQKIIWDAYVLGHGYYKIGYTTKFGMDVKDKDKKPRSIVVKAMESLGLKKPVEVEVEHPEVNYSVVSEAPYFMYISPFDFGRDFRALTLEESMYWYHKTKRTVKYMKENPKYKNTKDLKGDDPVDIKIGNTRMTSTEIEDFKTIELFEIHYRNDNKSYLLVISKDSDEYREHYHEESIYEIDGWQCDELCFNKHGHSAFAISDMAKIKNLQDRYTSTIDAILEQVDRLNPKIAYNKSDMTEEGVVALRDGDIGALVETTKNPNEVFKELMFTQFKSDLKALSESIIDIVTITTGLTKAQLMGISTADTATEARITQGGQTLRISDMNRAVSRFSRRQASKLWQVVKQFVELDELQLINGVSGVDEQGIQKYNWLLVSPDQKEKMIFGEYDFDIEVGSSQKPDLASVRGQFENLFSILARTDVVMLMQQQGKKLDIGELLKIYLFLFPEAVKDIGRIIQTITPQTQGLLPPPMPEAGGTTKGSNFNALEKQATMNQVGPVGQLPGGL